MKRITALFISLIIVCACCVINASAAESYDLIPSADKADDWKKTACQGYNIEIEYTDEATVFSAESVWPCADFTYADEDRITVSVEDYTLVYDFSVSTGATNINFTFTDGFGSSDTYSIANNTLGTVSYDGGSGDLYAGDYKGVIKLTDLVNATMFFGSKAFPSNLVVDGKLTFAAIQVYSVSGATVTVRELSLVPNEEVPEEPAESSEVVEESSEVIAESSEDITESVADSVAVSDTESTVASTAESVEESTDTTVNEDEGLGVWLYVIIGAAVVVVIAVIVVIAKKKK